MSVEQLDSPCSLNIQALPCCPLWLEPQAQRSICQRSYFRCPDYQALVTSLWYQFPWESNQKLHHLSSSLPFLHQFPWLSVAQQSCSHRKSLNRSAFVQLWAGWKDLYLSTVSRAYFHMNDNWRQISVSSDAQAQSLALLESQVLKMVQILGRSENKDFNHNQGNGEDLTMRRCSCG